MARVSARRRKEGATMKKLTVSMLLFAVASVPGVANATHDGSANPPIDFVRGGGFQVFPPPSGFTFGIAAKSGPAGEDPSGAITAESVGTEASFHAEVTCVIVSGNQAFVTGVFTQPPEVEGDITVFHGVDTGGPGGPPDLIRFSFPPFIFPAGPDCFLPVLAPVPVTEGNILVHDGS
jgi:hypothetical protein